VAKLPPLPEPLIQYPVTFGTLVGYTQDQMRQYAQNAVFAAKDDQVLPGTFNSAEELIRALRSDRAIFGLNDGQLNEILVEAQRLTDDWAERQLIDPIRVETNAHCVKEIVRLIYMAKQP
jgi:hypothetical protein